MAHWYSARHFCGVAVSGAARAHRRISVGADRLKFARWQLGTVVRAPFSLPAMAARAVALARTTLADCRRVTAPTLVVTGEQG
jgi:hypothetical protein